jgi:predicted membrane protein
MIQFLRVLSLLALILAAVVDYRFEAILLNKEWLYVLAVVILIFLLFVDPITGFILSLAVITIIVKMYNIKFPWSDKNNNTETLLEYITPEHLRDAQSNVVIDEEQFEKEWKGIQGVYGEDVYGAQGLEILPGYSKVTDNLE